MMREGIRKRCFSIGKFNNFIEFRFSNENWS
jgi:hypothetical protein